MHWRDVGVSTGTVRGNTQTRTDWDRLPRDTSLPADPYESVASVHIRVPITLAPPSGAAAQILRRAMLQ